MMSEDSYDPQKVTYELDESRTYKQVNQKNETSMYFEDDAVIQFQSNNNVNKHIVSPASQKPITFNTQSINNHFEENREDGMHKGDEGKKITINEHQQTSSKVDSNTQGNEFIFDPAQKKMSTNMPPNDHLLQQIQVSFVDQTPNNNKGVKIQSMSHAQRRISKALNKLLTSQEKCGDGPSLFMLTRVKPKILNYIQQFTSFGRKRLITKGISNLINDPVDYEYKKNAFLNSRLFSILLLNQFIKIGKFVEDLIFGLLNYLPLFNPENKFRICINLIIACYSCFYLFITSLNLFFDAQFGHLDELFHQIATAAWISEMLLSMNTFCYHHGQFITNRKQIIKIYLQEYFFFEVLPLVFEGRSSDNLLYNVLLHLPLLLKLQGISIIMTKIEFFILQHIKQHQFIQFLKLVIEILLLTHLMACSYYALGQYEKYILKDSESWIVVSVNGGETQWQELYFQAQYWAFLTMSSSYSQAVNTQYEHAFTSFWMLISCILYAFLINKIGDILRDVNSQSENYKKNLNVLNRYMKRKKIRLELQREMNIQLKKNYEHFNNKMLEEERDTLNQLGTEMKEKLITESNKEILAKFPFFQNKVSQQSLTQLYGKFEEETYTKGEFINLRDPNNYDPHMFLITKGEVELMYEEIFSEEKEEKEKDDEDYLGQPVRFEKEKETSAEKFASKSAFLNHELQKKTHTIKRLGEGQCLGEQEFFTNLKANILARCTRKTILTKISRSNLVSILQQNGNDYEIFKELQDCMMFTKNYSLLQNLNCYFCSSNKHQHQDCYLVHFSKNNPFIVPKSNQSILQNRSDFERKSKPKRWIVKQIEPQSYLDHSEINYSTLKYISENINANENKNNDTSDQNQLTEKQEKQEKGAADQTIVSKDKVFPINKSAEISNLIYEDLWQNDQNLALQSPLYLNPLQMRSKQAISNLPKEDQDSHHGLPQIYNEQTDKNVSNILCSIFTDDLFKQKDQEESNKKYRQSKLKTHSIIVDINDIVMQSNTNIKDRQRNSIIKPIPSVQTLQPMQQQQLMQICSLDNLGNQVQKIEQSTALHLKQNEKQIFAYFTWNESIAYWLFDSFKEYKAYFPKFNYKQIIKKCMNYKKNEFKKKRIKVQRSKVSQATNNNI